MTQQQIRKNQYYPLLSVPEHEMEGILIAFVRNDYQSEIMLTLVNDTQISWKDYEPQRRTWEKEGYPSTNGQIITRPRIFDYDEDYYGPRPDMEDAHATVLLWQNAQHRLERAQQPLSICFLTGDWEELDDWATEPDLVSLVKERFPGDERFDGHFRLLLEVPVGNYTEETTFQDVSWLNAYNWNIVMNGTMPLEFIVDYLDEEEVQEKTRLQERAETHLTFYTCSQSGNYTLEDWYQKPFYQEEFIHLEQQLKQKYPELKGRKMELYTWLSGQQEPETIGRISQQMQKRILEGDQPLVGELRLF